MLQEHPVRSADCIPRYHWRDIGPIKRTRDIMHRDLNLNIDKSNCVGQWNGGHNRMHEGTCRRTGLRQKPANECTLQLKKRIRWLWVKAICTFQSSSSMLEIYHTHSTSTTPTLRSRRIMATSGIRRSSVFSVYYEPCLFISEFLASQGVTDDVEITFRVGRHNHVELRDSQKLKLRLRGATHSGKNFHA